MRTKWFFKVHFSLIVQQEIQPWSCLSRQGYLQSKQTKMLSIQLFPYPQFSPMTWNLTDFPARQACLHLADGNIYLGFRWKTRLRCHYCYSIVPLPIDSDCIFRCRYKSRTRLPMRQLWLRGKWWWSGDWLWQLSHLVSHPVPRHWRWYIQKSFKWNFIFMELYNMRPYKLFPQFEVILIDLR